MKRRDYLRFTAGALGVSATGCLSALGDDRGSEDAYLGPPSEINDGANYPTYGEPVPEVELLDVFTEETVSTDQNEEYLMNFFYASCPTECLWTVSSLTHTESAVVDEGGAPPRILAATFDPARDTYAKLHDYADRMEIDPEAGNWSFLRPESEERAEEVIGDKFGVSFAKRSIEDGVYDFIHTTLILLVNKDGYVERAYTNEEPNPYTMADDLATLRERQKTA